MAEDPLESAFIRVFLAIPLHDIFQKELEGLLQSLGRHVSSVHWVNPQHVHLTLHFFGFLSTDEIERIHLSSKKVASFFPPLKLKLNRVGGFPSLERPNVVWLGIDELSGRLLSLQEAIRDEIQALGFKTETRPFLPHATIGRVRKKSKDLESLLTKVPFEWPTSEKAVDHFALYQSYCLPEGARYEILKTYPLSKKA